MFLYKRFCPSLDKREMAYYIHHSYSQSFLVTSEEEPDSGHTEHSNSSEHSAHKEVYWLGKDVKEYRKKYYDARHCCYAYRVGFDGTEFRANDVENLLLQQESLFLDRSTVMV